VSTPLIIMLVILGILIIAVIVLYVMGKKAEKKQAAQKEQMDAIAQTVSMLIIDKGKMRLRDSGLPSAVLENTPKYLRRAKVPVVKAKVGPKIMTLMCDAQIFPLIPVKKEVKAVISGIYITGVKGLRGSLETPQKKKGFFARLRGK
jgi:type II secretory pathway pseudopilin PulG